MSNDKRPTALITGASGGIGLDLAKRFAADGYDLVLVARSTDKLEALGAELAAAHQITARAISADLSDPSAPEAIKRELDRAGIEVEALVNNAAFGRFGTFAGETRIEDELRMIQLNVIALTHLTKLFVPAMVARKSGRVMNVASTAAFQPGPLMAIYYATKAFVLSFSEAIAEELEGTGVTVTALCPGPTATGFVADAQMEDSKLFRGKKIMSSDDVARIGYAGFLRGKRVVIPGAKNKLLAQSIRFVPRNMVTKIVRRTQERAV